jgi:hypothetical protein
MSLREVAGNLGTQSGNRTLIIRLFTVRPEFCESPGRMIQEQAAEREQPGEEEQKQPGVEMKLAIPKRDSAPRRNVVRRFNMTCSLNG